MATQAGIVGGASGVSGVLGNAYLGQPITTQSVAADTLIGSLTFGAGSVVPNVSGRLPNLGTRAFFSGKHTQQSAMQLGVGSISGYTSQIIGSANIANSGGSSQGIAKTLGIGNMGGGGFAGTYNFGSSVGTYNFGTESWVSTARSTPAIIKK